MRRPSQFRLLARGRFGPYFATQFLGAFNDNLLRIALFVLVAYQGILAAGQDANTFINLGAAVFILPFLLFSAQAGQLADKLEKSTYIRYVKLFELAVAGVGAVAVLYGHIWLLLLALFLMGTQSAFFGPVKYSILREILGEPELLGGNALVVMATFLAILFGTAAGSYLLGTGHDGRMLTAIAFIFFAALGYLSSLGIPRTGTARPRTSVKVNPYTAAKETLQYVRSDNPTWLSILGIAWFWFYGSLYMAQLPAYVRDFMGGDEQGVSVALSVFAAGIGIGALGCERLSRRRIEIGLVPFGSIGLTLFGMDLYFARPETLLPVGDLMAFLQVPGQWRLLLDMFMSGLFGGFFVVPLYAMIQLRSKPGFGSRTIAGLNIMSAFWMLLSAGMAIALLRSGFSIPELFLLAALLNALVAIYIYTIIPVFLLRFVTWLMIHIVYRVKEEGLDNIPSSGPAVLVCNHVSFVDALIVGGCIQRPVRFVMDYKIFNTPVLSWLFSTAKAIPIASSKDDADVLHEAFDRIAEELDDGKVVCIFPEGRITWDGQLNVFRGGVEKIVARNPVPVVPLALRGMWGSFFGRKDGPAMGKLPQRVWSRIGLKAGEPVPPGKVDAKDLQKRVEALRGDWL